VRYWIAQKLSHAPVDVDVDAGMVARCAEKRLDVALLDGVEAAPDASLVAMR
jgi:hypothetical protein